MSAVDNQLAALRGAISDLLGRPVPADEPVTDTVSDLKWVSQERAKAAPTTWQFSRVPELVVQVVDSTGQMYVSRLAGGTGQATGSGVEDPHARAYARTLLQLALDHLDATEPARATAGRAL